MEYKIAWILAYKNTPYVVSFLRRYKEAIKKGWIKIPYEEYQILLKAIEELETEGRIVSVQVPHQGKSLEELKDLELLVSQWSILKIIEDYKNEVRNAKSMKDLSNLSLEIREKLLSLSSVAEFKVLTTSQLANERPVEIIDSILPVPKGFLSLVIGATGVGKTMFMLNLACDLAEKGFKVAYMDFEMGTWGLAERVSKLSKRYKYNDQNLKFFFSSRLSSFDVSAIAGVISGGFDVLFIDLLNYFETQSEDSFSRYQALKSLAEELHSLCITNGTTIVGAVQGNRSSVDNVSLSSISESYAMQWIARNIIGIEKKLTNKEIIYSAITLKSTFTRQMKIMYKINQDYSLNILSRVNLSDEEILERQRGGEEDGEVFA